MKLKLFFILAILSACGQQVKKSNIPDYYLSKNFIVDTSIRNEIFIFNKDTSEFYFKSWKGPWEVNEFYTIITYNGRECKVERFVSYTNKLIEEGFYKVFRKRKGNRNDRLHQYTFIEDSTWKIYHANGVLAEQWQCKSRWYKYGVIKHFDTTGKLIRIDSVELDSNYKNNYFAW